MRGVSTRKVDELVQTLGIAGLSKSGVFRICAELDQHLEHFRNRPLEGKYSYVWLDAKGVKVRQEGRVVNRAADLVVRVRETGERESWGSTWARPRCEFWVELLRRLAARGTGRTAGGIKRPRGPEAGHRGGIE